MSRLLSPAAQAVLDAAVLPCTVRQGIAAALEAAADQVVPSTPNPADTEFWPDEEDERQWQYDRRKRAEILDIAAELRGESIATRQED